MWSMWIEGLLIGCKVDRPRSVEVAQFNTDLGALPLEHWNQWRLSTALEG